MPSRLFPMSRSKLCFFFSNVRILGHLSASVHYQSLTRFILVAHVEIILSHRTTYVDANL